MRLRLLHKGLILVLVPLIASAGFVFYLKSLLERADTQLDKQLQSFEILALTDTIVSSEDEADISMAVYQSLREEKYKGAHWDAVRRHFEALRRLSALVGNDYYKQRKLAQQRDLSLERQHWEDFLMSGRMRNMPLGSIFGDTRGPELMEHYLFTGKMAQLDPVTEEARQIEATAASEREQTDRHLQYTLATSIVISVLLTMILSLYFHRNITGRLRHIMVNVKNIPKRGVLAPPLGGSDQIAELDLAVHETGKQLSALEVYKRNLMSLVANELGRPLHNICTILDGLSECKWGAVPERATERVGVARRNMDRLVNLVNELGRLDQLEDAKLEMKFAAGALSDIISTACHIVRALAEKKRINLTVPHSDCTLVADKDRLVQVVVNLLSNAIKFSPEDSTITISAQTSSDSVKLSVSDQGRGMPKEFLKDLFGRFTQAYQTDATEQTGSGLGLSICRKIVEQHGGTIEAESELGKGTTFNVTLPLAPDHIRTSSAPEAKQQQGQQQQQEQEQGQKQKCNKSPKNILDAFSSDAKLWQKGLVLVGLPLALQLAFVAVLDIQLQQTDAQVQKLFKYRQVAATINALNRAYDQAAVGAFMFNVMQKEKYRQRFQDGVKKSKELANLLRTQVRPDQRPIVDALDANGQAGANEARVNLIERKEANVTLENLMPNKTEAARLYSYASGLHDGCAQLLESHQLQANLNPSTHAELRRQTYTIIWSGLVLDILLSLGLLVVIDRTINRRVSNVISNTRRLLNREPLAEPMPGDDEIADIDKAFFESGQRIVALEKFKDEMLSVVGHELRTPLSTVLGLLSLMKVGALGQFEPDAVAHVTTAEAETTGLIELINSLLDIERFKAGKLELEPAEYPVAALVNQAVSEISSEATRRSVEIAVSAEGTVFGDRARLVTAFKKLIWYSVQRSPEHAIVSISDITNGGSVELQVHDWGTPLSIQEAVLVLDPIGSANGDGTFDLSIPLVKAIADAHGGGLDVLSTPTGKCVFSLKLPISPYTAKT